MSTVIPITDIKMEIRSVKLNVELIIYNFHYHARLKNKFESIVAIREPYMLRIDLRHSNNSKYCLVATGSDSSNDELARFDFNSLKVYTGLDTMTPYVAMPWPTRRIYEISAYQNLCSINNNDCSARTDDLNLQFELSTKSREFTEVKYPRCAVTSEDNFQLVHKCTDCFAPLFQSKFITDVIFRVQGTEIPAHRAVLAKSSSYFHGMFTNGMQEEQGVVDVADVDVEIFRELLNFVYGASFQNIKENAERLLVVADKYDFKDLQAVCATVLSDQLSITNVVHVLNVAISHRVQAAKIKAIHFLKGHCESIVQTEDFQSLMHIKPKIMMEIFCAVCTQLFGLQGFSTSDSNPRSLCQSNDNTTTTCLPVPVSKASINEEIIFVECHVHNFFDHYELRHTFESVACVKESYTWVVRIYHPYPNVSSQQSSCLPHWLGIAIKPEWERTIVYDIEYTLTVFSIYNFNESIFVKKQFSSGEVHFLLPYDTMINNNEFNHDRLKIRFEIRLPPCSVTKLITVISEQSYVTENSDNCVSDRDGSIQFSEKSHRLSELSEKSFELINFQVKDKKFSANKIAVVSHSVVFCEKLKLDEAKRDFIVEDVDPEIFQELLNFMHDRRIENIEDIAEKLLEAANIYSVRGLQALCLKVLMNKLSDANCMSVLSFAILHGVEDFKLKSISYLKQNYKSILVRDEFKSLLHSNPKGMSQVLCAICSYRDKLDRIEKSTYIREGKSETIQNFYA